MVDTNGFFQKQHAPFRCQRAKLVLADKLRWRNYVSVAGVLFFAGALRAEVLYAVIVFRLPNAADASFTSEADVLHAEAQAAGQLDLLPAQLRIMISKVGWVAKAPTSAAVCRLIRG